MKNPGLPGRFAAVAVGICLQLTVSHPSVAQDTNPLEDCHRLVREEPENLEAYRCFWMVARSSGGWQASENALRQLLRESPDNPRAMLFLGSVLADQGRPEARSHFLNAADGFSEIGHLEGEVLALVSAIAELNKRQQIEEAEQLIERAQAVAGQARDEGLVSQVDLVRGWHFVAREDFDRASQVLDDLETRLTATGDDSLRYRTTEARAFVAWATGQYRTSSELYRRCLDLARQSGDVQNEAAAAYNMLLVTARIRGSEVSVEYLQTLYADALDAALKSGNARLEANARMSMGQPFDGDPGRRGQIEHALVAARTAQDPITEMAALRGLAQHDARSDPSRWPEARAAAEEAVELAKKRGSTDALIRGYLIRGSTFEQTQAREKALDEWYRAIDEIERLHGQQISEETGARIASRWSFAYYDLFARLINSRGETAPADEDISRALAVMERLRGHGKSELFTQAGARDVTLPASMMALPLDRIRAGLTAVEALVSYQLSTRGNGWAVVIGVEGAQVVPLSDVPAIEEAIELVSTLVDQDSPAMDRALARLSELIIDPVLTKTDAGVSRLVIVPDADLHRVPFAALRPKGETYLVETHTIELAPSVLAWLSWREKPEPTPTAAVLGFAGPLRPADDTLAAAGMERAVDDATRPIPHTVSEIESVCRLMGNDSEWFAGSDATEQALTSRAESGHTILHFATHASVDSANPSNTAVLLALGGADQDGRLTIADILALNHDARLVVVNSCRSASGVILQGRGVLGLAASFHASGARAVVGNLWPVKDSDASDLMISLYGGLAAGEAVADALATVQREAIRHQRPPQVWASLSVYGDGTLTFAPRQLSWRLVAAVTCVGLLLILPIAIIVRTIRNRRRKAG